MQAKKTPADRKHQFSYR